MWKNGRDMKDVSTMLFPKREWPDIKKRLEKTGQGSSTRCCQELNKYKAGQVWQTPWGDKIKITKVTRYRKLEEIPTYKYFDKGMKASARVGEKYGGGQWDHVLFELKEKAPDADGTA
jgi:hypothetical protein